MSTTSPRPSQARPTSLASFNNAYAVAIQMRAASGVDHFIIGTDNPMQPFRVARERPAAPETILALVA